MYHSGEHGGLGGGEVVGGGSEVGAGGVLDSEGVVAVADEVEVAGEDFVFVELFGDVFGGGDFGDFSGVGLFDCVGLFVFVFGGDKPGVVFDVLLGECGCALDVVGGGVGDGGAHDSVPVDALVFVVAFVFDGDDGVFGGLGDFVGGDGLAALGVEEGDGVAVFVADDGGGGGFAIEDLLGVVGGSCG